ncbi:hypothetical protein Misp01_29700 [Microtetraspora sp. NBRC 13810]|nr:hypothetical protein Misp01_29700 [Microtetraspora sp. NBRC 13810]
MNERSFADDGHRGRVPRSGTPARADPHPGTRAVGASRRRSPAAAGAGSTVSRLVGDGRDCPFLRCGDPGSIVNRELTQVLSSTYG